jgi:quercetin dioxygenase-like cupin family protein
MNSDTHIQIRRFGPDLKTKVPGGHPGLYAYPIAINGSGIPAEKLEAMAQRLNGLPLLLGTDLHVVALYFDPHASMDEHQADHPILFLAISGQGTMRLGGPNGETRTIQSGEAVLWPAYVDHAVWTDTEPLHAIAIEIGQQAR